MGNHTEIDHNAFNEGSYGSYKSTPESRLSSGFEQAPQVDICIFKEGEHVYMGIHCPHFTEKDEMGPRINPSWTVQSDPKPWSEISGKKR